MQQEAEKNEEKEGEKKKVSLFSIGPCWQNALDY